MYTFSICSQPFRVFNTWIGDPSKVILLEAVVKVIKEQNLLRNVNETGQIFFGGLYDLQVINCRKL
jgi:4-aminobutyrate aminotransferase/(S)-3-amino-2-methylpropionate transaminase